MSDWKDIKLDDYIVDIAAGPFGSNLKVECFVSSGFPIIDGANLKEVKVTDNITKFVTEEKARSLHRSIAKRNDVVVTISGNVGQISYIPLNSKYEEYLVSQRQFRVTFDTQKIYVPFLVYYFHSLEGQHKILSFANQTGVPALAQPLKNFKNIIIPLPNIKEQKRIASILVALDNKIENNRRIIANLEQQSQALFKSWFVDFEPFKGQPFVESELGMIPQGWKVVELGDLVEIIDNRGKTPPLVSKDIYPIIDVKALTGPGRVLNYIKCSKYVNHETYTSWFRNGHPKKYDILLSTVGSLAETKLFMGGNGCIAQNVVAFRNEKISLYLYDYLNSIKSDLVAYNIGSVQPSIKITHIIKHKIIVPQAEVLEKYVYLSRKLTEIIYNYSYEIDILSSLRDELLPRLMSGELRVPDTDLINDMLEKGIR